MTLKPPSSEKARFDNLDPQNRQYYGNLRNAMSGIAKENPELDTRIYTDYLDQSLTTINRAEENYKKTAATGSYEEKQAAQRKLNQEAQDFKKNFAAGIQEKIDSGQYGADAGEAWKKLDKRMKNPNIFSAAAKQVYDKDEGGFQLGGIIGLLGGAFIAAQAFNGFGNVIGGGFFPILATLGAGFLGAWLGNKAGDGIADMLDKKEKPAVKPAAAKAQEQAPAAPGEEPTNPLTPEVEEQAKNALDAPSATPAGGNPVNLHKQQPESAQSSAPRR